MDATFKKLVPLFLCLAGSLFLCQCADDQGADGQEEMQSDDYEDNDFQGQNQGDQAAGNNEGNEYGNEGQGNQVNDFEGNNGGYNQGANNGGYNQGFDDQAAQNGGEGLNNAMGNDTQAYGQQAEGGLQAEGEGLNNDSTNEFAMNETGMQQQEGMEAPMDQEMPPEGEADMDAGAQAAAPVPAPEPGGRVMYIQNDQVNVYSEPGGQIVGTKVRGEHPLIWIVQ